MYFIPYVEIMDTSIFDVEYLPFFKKKRLTYKASLMWKNFILFIFFFPVNLLEMIYRHGM